MSGSTLYEGVNEAGAPARPMDIQGDDKPPTPSRPADTYSSGNAGTGSSDMNKLKTRPSASEESVTSRVWSASHGQTHEQPHQEHEHQEPDIDGNTPEERQVDGDGTEEPEADGWERFAPPGDHAGGMPTLDPDRVAMQAEIATLKARLREQQDPLEKEIDQAFLRNVLSDMVLSFKSMAETGQSAARDEREQHESAAREAREQHEDMYQQGERSGRHGGTFDKHDDGDTRHPPARAADKGIL